MKVFTDSSAYLSALILHDPNNKRALEVLASIKTNKEEIITSHAVLGEVLTVASQKYDRNNKKHGYNCLRVLFLCCI